MLYIYILYIYIIYIYILYIYYVYSVSLVGGLGGFPHNSQNWLIPPCPPHRFAPKMLILIFCNFYAVFGHFAQIVSPQKSTPFEKPWHIYIYIYISLWYNFCS